MDAGIAIKPVFDHYSSVVLTSAVSNKKRERRRDIDRESIHVHVHYYVQLKF